MYFVTGPLMRACRFIIASEISLSKARLEGNTLLLSHLILK